MIVRGERKEEVRVKSAGCFRRLPALTAGFSRVSTDAIRLAAPHKMPISRQLQLSVVSRIVIFSKIFIHNLSK